MVDPGELRDVFDRAATLPPADRAAFLEQACGQNAALRREIERLLDADARGASAFDTAHTGAPADPSNPDSDSRRLSLPSGTRLGPYQITAALGAGGMGEVYKARDTRLDRTVAIKVLSRGLTEDPTARQRFEREARAVAGLSHHHICPLFDIGHQDGTDFLVMEYLAGETLAARLAGGKLPLDQALTYASEIAQALAAAHRAGIIHRDLKPGNVMVTTDGVKLLDFGLAKHSPRPVVSDTTFARSDPLTGSGVILGTVQYMAPEQLEGREADERTDIFAFGVVLYEMVTGRRAFEGPTTVALIGNILHADPPSPSSIAPLTPPLLDEVVRLCLGKDPAARYQSMTDVQSRLTAARNLAVRAPVKPVGGRWRAPAAAVLLAGAVAGLVWREWTRSQFQNPPPERVAVQRKLTRLTFDQGLQTEPTFSPDGRFIAYASDRLGNFDIWVQPLAGGEPVQITRSPEPDTQPSWSPDGGTIVFRSERDGGGLYVVPALGGDDRRLTKDGDHPTWSPDGKHVRYLTSSFEQAHKTLKEVSVEDGATQLLFPEFTEGGGWYWIAPHPDGRFSFLGFKPKLGLGFFTVSSEGTVVSSDVKRHLPAQLARFTDGTWDTYGRRFCWNRTGTALFLETQAVGTISNLWKIGVDPKTLDWVSFERLTTGPGADVRAALTPDGEHLAFSTLNESIRLYQFPFTADNKLTEGRPLTQEGAAVSYASVAPDGKSAVYNLGRFGAADPATLWHARLDSASSRQLGTDGSNARLSPDGRQVAYSKISADRTVGFAAVMVRSVDGGPERSLMPWQKAWVAANDWISDGTAVLVSNRALETWPVTTSPAKSPSRVVLAVPNAGLFQAKYSPNGRWLSFVVAHDSGGAQIGVASVDGVPDRKWIAIETDQPWADKPRWSTDGKRLYFLAGEGSFLNLWAIAFDAERGIPIGVPFPVARFTSPALRIDPRVSFTEMDVSSRGVFLTMQSSRGNIWMLDNVDK